MEYYYDHRERAWIEELEEEFEYITWNYRIELVAPNIEISLNSSPLGIWNPETRTITLSKHLIENHHWDITREIFKHEVAHQIVHEYFRVDDNHGEIFKKACEMIAVEKWAQKAHIDLMHSIPHWKDQKLSDEEERIHKKVEKLLALSNSSNEHEAILAMKMVKDLLKKHNFNIAKKVSNDDYVRLLITHNKKRTDPCIWAIVNILKSHYFVRSIQVNIYNPTKLESYKAIELAGTKNNVLMAEYVYWFLYRKINELWKEFAKLNKKKGTIAKNNYLRGLLMGFSEKLKLSDQNKSSDENKAENELMVIANHSLDMYYQKKYPRMVTIGKSKRYVDSESLQAGISHGKNISIAQPISKSQNTGLFLPS